MLTGIFLCIPSYAQEYAKYEEADLQELFEQFKTAYKQCSESNYDRLKCKNLDFSKSCTETIRFLSRFRNSLREKNKSNKATGTPLLEDLTIKEFSKYSEANDRGKPRLENYKKKWGKQIKEEDFNYVMNILPLGLRNVCEENYCKAACKKLKSILHAVIYQESPFINVEEESWNTRKRQSVEIIRSIGKNHGWSEQTIQKQIELFKAVYEGEKSTISNEPITHEQEMVHKKALHALLPEVLCKICEKIREQREGNGFIRPKSMVSCLFGEKDDPAVFSGDKVTASLEYTDSYFCRILREHVHAVVYTDSFINKSHYDLWGAIQEPIPYDLLRALWELLPAEVSEQTIYKLYTNILNANMQDQSCKIAEIDNEQELLNKQALTQEFPSVLYEICNQNLDCIPCKKLRQHLYAKQQPDFKPLKEHLKNWDIYFSLIQDITFDNGKKLSIQTAFEQYMLFEKLLKNTANHQLPSDKGASLNREQEICNKQKLNNLLPPKLNEICNQNLNCTLCGYFQTLLYHPKMEHHWLKNDEFKKFAEKYGMPLEENQLRDQFFDFRAKYHNE